MTRSEFLDYAQSVLALTDGQVTHTMLGQVGTRCVTYFPPHTASRYILQDDGSPLYRLCYIVINSPLAGMHYDVTVDGVIEPRYTITWAEFLESSLCEEIIDHINGE